MRSFYLINLALATISAILAVAILACSAHALSTFNQQQKNDAWLLPMWRDHFDIRDLQLAIATSTVITVLNLAFIAVRIMLKVRRKTAWPTLLIPNRHLQWQCKPVCLLSVLP